MLVTLSGKDMPGITRTLFDSLSGHGIVVQDIEQLVIRDRLVLAVLLGLGVDDDPHHVSQHIRALAETLNLEVTIEDQAQHVNDRRLDRFHITVLGAPLQPEAIAQIASVLSADEANIDRIRRIASYPVTAIVFEGSGGSIDELRSALTTIAAANNVDIAIQHAGLDRRGQHLVVMDVDSTLIQDEVIDVLADYAGVGEAVSEITAKAMAGELDFSEALQKRVALLAGLPADRLNDVRDHITLTPGARTLCRTLLGLGYRVCLVSGGFQEIIEPLANELKVDGLLANTLEIRDGVLTGRIIGPVVDRAAKRKALEDFAAEFRIPMRRTIAIGDGANDVDMLQAAGLGVAFNAKSPARAAADAQVNFPYLDSVLYLLGMSREDIEQSDAMMGVTTPAPALPGNNEIH
jgi:phosphoserine phosphatase